MTYYNILPLLEYDLDTEEVLDSRKLGVNKLLEVVRNITWSGKDSWKVLTPPEDTPPSAKEQERERLSNAQRLEAFRIFRERVEQREWATGEEEQTQSYDDDDDDDPLFEEMLRILEAGEDSDLTITDDGAGHRAVVFQSPEPPAEEDDEESDITFEDDPDPEFFRYAQVDPLLRLAYLRGEARKKRVQGIFDDILPELKDHFRNMWVQLGLPQEHPRAEVLIQGLTPFRMVQTKDRLFDGEGGESYSVFYSLPKVLDASIWNKARAQQETDPLKMGEMQFSFLLEIKHPRTGKLVPEKERFQWDDTASCWYDQILEEHLIHELHQYREPRSSYTRTFVDITTQEKTYRISDEAAFVDLMLRWVEEVGTRIYRLHMLAKVCVDNDASLVVSDLNHYQIQGFERRTLPDGTVVNTNTDKYTSTPTPVHDDEWPMFALHARFGG